MNISINNEHRHFVIPCEGGFSTMGFENVFKTSWQIVKKLHEKAVNFSIDLEVLDEKNVGTLKQYEGYRKLVEAMKNSGRKFGTWFSKDTPVKVQKVLENYRKTGARIRIFYGDAVTGRDWMEENDVLGRIGRSTGIMQIPLLIEAGEHAGPALLDKNIVRMIDATTRKELYRHPSYHHAELELVDNKANEGEYGFAVLANKKTVACFKSVGAAAQYIAFMTGESMEQPRS